MDATAAYATPMTDDSSDRHPEPVAVAAYPDRGEAEVTKAHLSANGIEAFILDEAEGGALPVDLASGGGVYVVVHAPDADVARALIAPVD